MRSNDNGGASSSTSGKFRMEMSIFRKKIKNLQVWTHIGVDSKIESTWSRAEHVTMVRCPMVEGEAVLYIKRAPVLHMKIWFIYKGGLKISYTRLVIVKFVIVCLRVSLSLSLYIGCVLFKCSTSYFFVFYI